MDNIYIDSFTNIISPKCDFIEYNIIIFVQYGFKYQYVHAGMM